MADFNIGLNAEQLMKALNAVQTINNEEPDENHNVDVNVDATNVSYDNTESELEADNVQTVIDEVVGKIEQTNTIVATKANASDVTGLQTQVASNTSNINTINTTTNSLQNQINNIVTPVTVDAEVQNARVGSDGTSHASLKARLDSENTSLKEDLTNVNSRLEKIELDVNGMNELVFTNKGNDYIDTSVSPVDVNSLVSGASNTWRRCVVSCVKGDTFKVSVLGGNRARAWAFLDSQNNIILSSEPNVDLAEVVITAPENSTTLVIQTFDDDAVERKSYAINTNPLTSQVKTIMSIIDGAFIDLTDSLVYSSGAINIETGALYTSLNFKCTNFVDVSAYKGANINVTMPIYTSSTGDRANFGLAFYDSEKAFIPQKIYQMKLGENSAEEITINIPENASYFRTTYYKDSYHDYTYDKDYICNITKAGLTEEITDIKEEISNTITENVIVSLDERELCEYYGLLVDGTVEASANFAITSFINCIPKTTITISVPILPVTSTKEWGLCFYDADKNFISAISFNKSSDDGWGCELNTITVPDDASYFKTCFLSESVRNDNNFTFEGSLVQKKRYREYQDGYIFFSSKVNQSVNNYWNTDAETELSENMKMTTGVLALPESYSPNGKPTPLIMYFHGYSHGVWYGTWGADDEFRLQKQHWLEKGFAVMDCNGARNNNKTGHFTSGGSRQYVDGYRKCFEYIKEHYNVEDDIYVVAGSAGGIAGINYSMWYPNVKAMCLLSAWTDLLLCSWNQDIRDTIEEYLGFTNTTDYEIEKTKGFDPALRILNIGEDEYLPMLKVPTLALIGSTETTSVFYNPLHRFINAARNAGNTASIRVIDGATHKNIVSGGVQFIDDEVANWFKSN